MAEQNIVHMTQADYDEPLDRLGGADIDRLQTALRMYYGDLKDMGADHRELAQIAGLSRRLADVSLTWVAEVNDA